MFKALNITKLTKLTKVFLSIGLLSLLQAPVMAKDLAYKQDGAIVDETSLNIPCPSFWSVEPNPNVENSLSYIHDSGKIAVNVTYIAAQSGEGVGAENFARVAAEQMNCSLPVKSNILAKAWVFTCEENIEALVYGEPGDLVLLSISGRSDETESYLEGFMRFLSYQAAQKY